MGKELLEPRIVYIPDGRPSQRDTSVNVPSAEITVDHEISAALKILVQSAKDSGIKLLIKDPDDGSFELELERVRAVDAKRQEALTSKLMNSISGDPE